VKALLFDPDGPSDASEAIGESDGSAVVAAGLLDAQGPKSQVVRLFLSFGLQ